MMIVSPANREKKKNRKAAKKNWKAVMTKSINRLIREAFEMIEIVKSDRVIIRWKTKLRCCRICNDYREIEYRDWEKYRDRNNIVISRNRVGSVGNTAIVAIGFYWMDKLGAVDRTNLEFGWL